MNAQKALHLPLCFCFHHLYVAGTKFLADGLPASEPHNFTLWTHLSDSDWCRKTPVGLHDSPPYKKVGCIRSLGEMSIKTWLVVEPTHLKNMLVRLGSSSPSRDENKKCLKPPPSNLLRIVATDHFHGLPPVTAEFPTPKIFRDKWLVRCRRRPKLKVFANLRFFGVFDPSAGPRRRGERSVVQIPWSTIFRKIYRSVFPHKFKPIHVGKYIPESSHRSYGYWSPFLG